MAANEELETAWLAGLLEGEGCFVLHLGRYATVQLAMTDEDVVIRAFNIASGAPSVRCSPRPGREGVEYKDAYTVTWSGRAAADLMWRILPMMGERRSEKILTVLADWYERRTRVCQMCGEEFVPSNRAGPAKFCSSGCSYANNEAWHKANKAKRPPGPGRGLAAHVVEEILSTPKTYGSAKMLAGKFGIHSVTVSRIRRENGDQP